MFVSIRDYSALARAETRELSALAKANGASFTGVVEHGGTLAARFELKGDSKMTALVFGFAEIFGVDPNEVSARIIGPASP